MVSSINTNLNSMTAQRQLSQTGMDLSTAIQRLSSGLRINSARDDAAGLAIAERFTAQIRGTDQAARNTNDGISLAQTTDGALASISGNLQRMRELAVQSANGTNSASDRAALQTEAAQLIAENDRIAGQSEFNGNKLLDGSFNGQQFQVGGNRQQSVTIGGISSMKSDALGIYNGFGTSFIGNPTIGAASNLTVTLNGPGTAVNLGPVATDGQAIIDAINNSGVAGLAAAGNGFSKGWAATSSGVVDGVATLTVNGTAINIAVTAGAANIQTRLKVAAAAINAQSAATGVVATASAGTMNLYNSRNSNMSLSYSAGTATGSIASDIGIIPGQYAGWPSITYQAPTGSAVTSVDISGAGLGSVSTTVLPVGTALRNMDISTALGAQTAIQSIDTALTTVNATRATMGALQNRFQSTIASLQSSAQNLNASRGRIVDADVAQETANLSRAQILQQAGTAMVVQANQSPQGVLALLR